MDLDQLLEVIIGAQLLLFLYTILRSTWLSLSAFGQSVFTGFVCVTSRNSYANLSRWLDDARALASPNLVTVLVGNKSDRADDREVPWAEASRWAAQHGVYSFI